MAEAEEITAAEREAVAFRTRGALEEIPRPTTITLGQTQTDNLRNGSPWSSTINLSTQYLAQTSPDELIIQSRGRRSLPLEWSPIPIESPIKRSEKTPIKRSPGKGMIVLRSSPRKRLQLTDTPPTDLKESRRMMMQMSPIMKKCRSLTVSPQSPPEVAIKGLSQTQLVNVLSYVLDRHPELKDEVSGILPQPDIEQMEDRLSHMKKTIFKALPMSRLTSKTDSPAYSKAAPHLINFKKTIQDQCTQLVEAEQWTSLVNYCLIAWSYVRATPVWDAKHHNGTRHHCFRILTQHCLQGVKEGFWKKDELENLVKRLEQCHTDYADVVNCIEHIKTVMSNQE